MAFLTNNMRIDDSDQVLIMLDSEGSYDASPTVTFNKKILASDVGSASFNDAHFGRSIAISNTHLIIGAPDDGLIETDGGSVYAYNLEGDSSSEIKFYPSDLATNDEFGYSVAAMGNKVVVGSRLDDTPNTSNGAAYVYELTSDSAIDEYKLISESTGTGGYMGTDVAMGSGRILVNVGDSNGQVNIYDYNGSNIGTLFPDNTATSFSEKFGGAAGLPNQGQSHVAIGSGRVAVGSPDDEVTGAVYIFDLNGNKLNKIYADDSGVPSRYGIACAIGHDRIVVGDPSWRSGSDAGIGRAYLYDLDGNLIKKLDPSRPVNADQYYGNAIAIGNNTIAVSCAHDSNGVVYLYDLDGNETQIIPFENDRPVVQKSGFGKSVAINQGKLIIGYDFYSHDFFGDDYGAAYLYDFTDKQPDLLDLLDDF